MTRLKRLVWTIAAAVLAFVPGCLLSMGIVDTVGILPRIERVPLPHHVPRYPDSVSFRFAMVHDVLHERFPKHGPAYYQERERRARDRLAQIPQDCDEALALYDDIGVGLERLGRPADAIPILRKKLEIQQNRRMAGRDLYTTYANLGTFIAHANMPKAISGDPRAKKSVEEGIEFVNKSIAVNSEAHFGREIWQVVLAKFLIAAISDSTILEKFDFIGNSLDVTWKNLRDKVQIANSEFRISDNLGRPFQDAFPGRWILRYDQVRNAQDDFKPIDQWDEVRGVRDAITQVGHQQSWTGESIPDKHRNGLFVQECYGVPFDEPMLGIIGMWRQGGGANPHFALCIGETMLRVGQRRIAWSAFERTKALADKFWPNPEIQKQMRSHCDGRQKEIEATLPADVVGNLRPNFESELAFGQKYQREYQAYESAKIASGGDISDEHFFDEFNATQPSIATQPGSEEWVEFSHGMDDRRLGYIASGAFFLSGLAAFLTSVLLLRRAHTRAYGNQVD